MEVLVEYNFENMFKTTRPAVVKVKPFKKFWVDNLLVDYEEIPHLSLSIHLVNFQGWMSKGEVMVWLDGSLGYDRNLD